MSRTSLPSLVSHIFRTPQYLQLNFLRIPFEKIRKSKRILVQKIIKANFTATCVAVSPFSSLVLSRAKYSGTLQDRQEDRERLRRSPFPRKQHRRVPTHENCRRCSAAQQPTRDGKCTANSGQTKLQKKNPLCCSWQSCDGITHRT